MNYNEKINSFSISTIILSLCTSCFYGIFSSYIINKTNNTSLLSITIGFIISLLISFIIYKFLKYKEDLTYTQKIKYTFPKLSFIINIISILSSIFGYMLLSYRLTSFLSNEYLILTPNYLISLLILSLTYYTSSKGIQTVIRVSYITFFISIIIFIFDFTSLVSSIDINNYLPLITINIKDIITSSFIFSTYFIIPIIYINTIPLNIINDNTNFIKYYYLMITISFIIIFISIFTSIGVMGSNTLSIFDYPIYSTLKRIKLFSALDSLENISISAWFLFIINTLNIMLVYIFSGIKEQFNLKKDNSIIKIIIMLLLFIIPNFIISNNNFNEFYDYIYIPIIFLLITLFIIIITLIKKGLNKS